MTAPEIPEGARTFANAQRAVINYLKAKGFAVGAEQPKSTYPYAMVTRTGGPSDDLTDHARIDVDVFHTSMSAAANAASKVHYWMTDIYNGLRGQVVGIDEIDDVEVKQGPSFIDYGDPKLKRYVMTYTVDSRIGSTPLT